jgi:BirA family biotin operon repressor/biotin-[acetyl-CoA-carboxylase] ligase
MNVTKISSRLAGLPVTQIRYFDVIGSTNDEALRWAEAGTADGCLVVADQQTQARGRLGRRWVTNPGAALAFSLILHPTPNEQAKISFFSPLGALAICQALESIPGLAVLIKWPNDVLIQRKKTAGILVEAAWLGDRIQSLVIGIGINIAPAAVPPAGEILFPATSVEEAAGIKIDRLDLLRAILQGIFYWRAKINEDAFHAAWEQRLAFKGEWVKVEEASGSDGHAPIIGQVTGLDEVGNLILHTSSGENLPIAVGDLHLRLIE